VPGKSSIAGRFVENQPDQLGPSRIALYRRRAFSQTPREPDQPIAKLLPLCLHLLDSAPQTEQDIVEETFCLTGQTICRTLPPILDLGIRRLLDAYPAIFLACHRQHVRDDEAGKAITEHQASVLDHLHATRPTTLSKLAEHMGVGRSAMSITAKRLVRGGYVRSTRDKNDARCVGLALTPAGARVKEQNAVLDPELVKKMFRLMSAGELETALQGIECLARQARILLRQRTRGGRG
jgi:DNA-binding MarR family transcriptional regulator